MNVSPCCGSRLNSHSALNCSHGEPNAEADNSEQEHPNNDPVGSLASDPGERRNANADHCAEAGDRKEIGRILNARTQLRYKGERD